MSTLLRTLPVFLLGVLLLAGLAAAVSFLLRQLNLYPPTALSIAAGEPGSAYYASALRYREVLARDNIELTIIESAGSVANARSIGADGGADIALVQGGVSLPEDTVGLAAVRLEPLWIFASAPADRDPHAWAGQRISAGGTGSGTRQIADALERITGARALAEGNTLPLGGMDAAKALQQGDLDIGLFVAPAEATYVQTLLNDEGMRLQTLAHGEALALRLEGARLTRMPSGILDYERPLPARDIELIALVTRLVAREDIHPALVNRLVHAVTEVHGGRTVLPDDRAYPAATDLGIEADAYAVQLFDKGFSPLEKLLPYWIVAQLNRVLLVLLPAILLLLPLMRLLPAVYGAILSRRVYRHYARVHEIDEVLLNGGLDLNDERLLELREELDAIERELLRANLPNSYRKQAYTLLHHLDYVRKRGEEIMALRVNTSGDATA